MAIKNKSNNGGAKNNLNLAVRSVGEIPIAQCQIVALADEALKIATRLFDESVKSGTEAELDIILFRLGDIREIAYSIAELLTSASLGSLEFDSQETLYEMPLS